MNPPAKENPPELSVSRSREQARGSAGLLTGNYPLSSIAVIPSSIKGVGFLPRSAATALLRLPQGQHSGTPSPEACSGYERTASNTPKATDFKDPAVHSIPRLPFRGSWNGMNKGLFDIILEPRKTTYRRSIAVGASRNSGERSLESFPFLRRVG